MKYKAIRNRSYDFIGKSYGEGCYPNMHQYPATMIPQLGIKILEELGVKGGKMLDPYCGSGSSFASGIEVGLKDFTGFDMNPLAVLICKSKFTPLDLSSMDKCIGSLRKKITKVLSAPIALDKVEVERFPNFNYWFSDEVAKGIQVIKNEINKVSQMKIKNLLLVALSLTIRACSYVRNNEFKLYRIKQEDMSLFHPNVLKIFLQNLDHCKSVYETYYHPKISDIKLDVGECSYSPNGKKYDIVLTSPPYGDSKTTVAYGQFSLFSNAWVLGNVDARALDKKLMGGKPMKGDGVCGGFISDYIYSVAKEDLKRASEVSSFYIDLKESIANIAGSVKKGGKAVYVVGNRTVKKKNLPTDKFVAECFENNGFRHLMTYERSISNKRMPKLNSPSNVSGEKVSTMNSEFIVICEKVLA